MSRRCQSDPPLKTQAPMPPGKDGSCKNWCTPGKQALSEQAANLAEPVGSQWGKLHQRQARARGARPKWIKAGMNRARNKERHTKARGTARSEEGRQDVPEEGETQRGRRRRIERPRERERPSYGGKHYRVRRAMQRRIGHRHHGDGAATERRGGEPPPSMAMKLSLLWGPHRPLTCATPPR